MSTREDAIQPIEKISSPSQVNQQERLEKYRPLLEAAGVFTGSNLSFENKDKIFSILSNPEDDLNRAALEGMKTQIEHQTELAKFVEWLLHHYYLLENQLPPKNLLDRRVEVIGEA